MKRHRDRKPNEFPKIPLLISESVEDFESFLAELEEEIEIRNVVDRIYVGDFAHLVWEIACLRRCKVSIVNSAFRLALRGMILKKILPQPKTPDVGLSLSDIINPSAEELERRRQADELIDACLAGSEAGKRTMASLQKFNFSLADAEALAVQSAFKEIETIDRMITSLETRRNKALACIADYRDRLAQQLAQSTESLEGSSILTLTHSDQAN